MPLMMNCEDCPRLRFDPELPELARAMRSLARQHCLELGHVVAVIDREASLVYSRLGTVVLLERYRVTHEA